MPGLHPHERKWSRVVAAIAGPLFFAGVALGYYVLPKGISVLIAFVPDDVTNLVDFGAYFSFVTRMLLIFGVAMEIPFFVILLNLAGVVSGRALGRYRPWIVIGVFVFAAVATPSTDPFSMLMLAIPMQVLFLVAEIVARIVDRARGRGDDQHRPVGRRRGLARSDDAAPMSVDVDPFDLPDWLGEGEVTWTPEGGIHDGHLVPGSLTGGDEPLPCAPARRRRGLPEAGGRRRAAPPGPPGMAARPGATWSSYDDRLTLAVPGTVVHRRAGPRGARPAGQGRRRPPRARSARLLLAAWSDR